MRLPAIIISALVLGAGLVTISRADSGSPGAADEAALLDEKTPPDEVARRLREMAKTGGRKLHHSQAVAGNTRGYRLAQAGQCDAALPIFEAAAALDAKYGMPRYSAARKFPPAFEDRGQLREHLECGEFRWV